MRTANMHEAKTQLSKLIEAALQGEEVVIARRGVPAVKLVPIPAPRPDRRGGWLAGQITFVDPDWERTDPELERAFSDSVLASGDGDVAGTK